ncbi:DUF2975 domain-containing protein [Clostridium sp. JNZ X4-2]
MFDKNFSSIITFLCVLLNIFFVMAIIALISIPGFLWLGITIKSLVFAEIDSLICLLIVYELKNAIGRIKEDKAFVMDNVKGFTKVGIYIFLLGVAYMINDIMNGSLRMIFAFNKDGSLKLDIFAFIIMGCASIVVAQVLKKAIQIKSENDLTV